MNNLLKKTFKFLLVSLFAFTLITAQSVANVQAETVVGNTTELIAAVNAATEGEVIVLSNSFISQNVTVNVNANNIVIDGQNNTFTTGTFTIGGSGTGSITLKNLKFPTQAFVAVSVNTSSKVILDNLHIEGRQGGGVNGSALVFAGSANLVVKNSTFLNNINSSYGYTGTIGSTGFIGTVVFENNIIQGNKTLDGKATGTGGQGGGISFHLPGATANITIRNNYFVGNEAGTQTALSTSDGGAISFFNILNGIKINIEGNTFSKNIAGDDGGAILIQSNDTISSGVEINNNVFYQNVAQSNGDAATSGGAIQLYANGSLKQMNVHFNNNSFIENEARNTTGGAVASTGYFSSSKGWFANNVFAGNKSSNDRYNNTYGSANVNSGGNIGYDNGTASTVTVEDVYGDYTLGLSTVNSSVHVGYSDTGTQALLPTLYIKPAGAADNTSGVSSLTTDQLGHDRSTSTSDAGASEIGYVLFDANGGSFVNETVNKTYNGSVYQVFETKALPTDPDVLVQIYGVSYLGGTVSAPTDPEKENSTFLGYSLTATGSVLSASDLTDILNDVAEGITLYAIYDDVQDTYNVTYVGNGNTGGTVPVDTTDYEAGDTVNIPTSEPTKSGFTFEGWSDGTTTYQPGNSFTMPASNVTLTSVWEAIVVPVTYKVTYDGNGNTGGTVPVDTTDYEAGDTVNIPTSEPTKSGFTFEGWSDGTTTYQPGNSFTMPASNVTLTAVWEAIVVPVTYKVTYDGNGSNGGIIPSDSTNYSAGDTVVVSTSEPTKTGFTFKGWNNGTTTYQPGNSFTMPASNVTLTAVWEAIVVPVTYNVTYVGNGHTGGIVPVDTLNYEAGDIVTVVTGVPTKSGSTFKGWTDGTTIYQAGETFVMPASNVTLTAVWETNIIPVTYKVTYVGNGHIGGTIPVDTSNYEAGDIVTVLTGVPTKSGSTFKGWTDGTTIYQAGETFVMPASNVTLTAVWEAIVVPVSYSVTYVGNGHTGGIVPVDANRYTFGFNVTVLEGTPTRTDYTFKGWTDGTATYQAGDTFVMPAGNVTLTAVWEAINRPTLPNTGVGINYGSVSIITMGGVLLVAALIMKRKEQA